MTTYQAISTTIHSAILGIVQTAAAADLLAVDARDVAVLSHLPDHEFSQRQLPAVVVERPTERDSSNWGNSHVRREWVLPLVLVDFVGVGPDSEASARARLDLLGERVRIALLATDNLNLAFLHVFSSAAQFAAEEDERVGNNLITRQINITLWTHSGKSALVVV